jgi:hypothetical protein
MIIGLINLNLMHFIPSTSFRNICLLICCLLPAILFSQTISRIGNSPYPATATPDTLYMVNMTSLTQSQQLSVVTLQGLLARVKPQIMVNLGATDYINDLTQRYGVTYDSLYFNDFRGLVNHFKPSISGYIFCNINDSTTNAAISVCAMLHGIAVTAIDSNYMDSIGIPQIYSTIDKGEQWSFDTFQNNYSKKIISIQDPTKCTFLSDYSVFAGAFHFWDFPTLPSAEAIFSSIHVNGAVFGWAAENLFVSATSLDGLHVHASDFSSNLSTYSNFNIPQQHQINHTDDTILKPGVHTVCFVMTDGDNIQWVGGGFENQPNWYGNPNRGQYNIGWTLSPALADIAPTQMKYLYDSARTTATGRDGFIAAASGLGYSYPDLFSIPDSGADITSRMMQKADMSILNVIANNYSRAELAPYLNEPNINAIFYYTYEDNYYGANGFVDCINDKPVISARYNLVQPDYSTYSLAQILDTLPKDPNSSSGYSLVAVNVWSSSVDSVIKCIQMLDSNVRVVTPESFVKLYMAGNNCIPQSNVGIASIKSGQITVYSQPNPATDRMEIIYTLPMDSKVQATLYDQYGQKVRDLFSDYNTSGTHSTTVDTHSLSAGLYYYTLQGDYFSEARKCIIVK